MLGDDRPALICPGSAGARCPGRPCPGASDPGVCGHLGALRAWRARSPEAQRAGLLGAEAVFRPSDIPARGRIRVGLWCPCLGLGGAEAWQLALTRAVDPKVVSWRGAAVFEGSGMTDRRMVAELSAIMPVGFGLGAARALAAASDVILSWAVTDVAAIRAGLADPPRVAMVCHFPGESPWGGGTVDLLAGVDRLVAVSELAAEAIPAPLRAGAGIIWNAVDAGRMEVRRDREEMRSSWAVPPGVPVAGYLGRLSPEKDPDAMIRLAEALPEPWHVVLVGEGRERATLAGRIRSLGLDRARLAGGDLAAGDVLNAFDALVLPSLYESFGLTLSEGLWAGVPVVATRSGLAKLAPGLVRPIPVAAGSKELAGAVLADRADGPGTRERVARARAFARDRLGSDRFGRQWTDLIIDLARRPPGSGPGDGNP